MPSHYGLTPKEIENLAKLAAMRKISPEMVVAIGQPQYGQPDGPQLVVGEPEMQATPLQMAPIEVPLQQQQQAQPTAIELAPIEVPLQQGVPSRRGRIRQMLAAEELGLLGQDPVQIIAEAKPRKKKKKSTLDRLKKRIPALSAIEQTQPIAIIADPTAAALARRGR
jgi:hypothetical protein